MTDQKATGYPGQSGLSIEGTYILITCVVTNKCCI